LLLAHVLSVQREYLHSHDERLLTQDESQDLEDKLYDRISGVPLQYIVGRQEFYGRYFRVNPSVLIPRPETEFIVETVLEIEGTRGRPPRPLRVLDVGTGSGCIAVTLALELSGSEVTAADVSFDALLVARENAAALGANIQFVCMDVVDGISGRFDFIVSNPPYVSREDISRLQREVREHEPHIALFSPQDALAIYRRLALGGEEMLKPRGYLILEVGIGMDERVLELFGKRWEKLPTKTDLQGIPRTVIAKLRGD